MSKCKGVLVILAVLLLLPLGYFFLFKSIFLSQFKYDLLKSQDGITSILVLGKGGEGHTAPDLTDTMMVTFLNQSSKKINVLSLPRDIWVPEIRAKLNSAYYWGKERKETNFELVNTSVEEIIGMPVSYTVVVDFSMFKDLVDALGGINVDVANSFIDNKFPIVGKENDLCEGDSTYACRYETISFEKGLVNMDGVTALKFVRSRNSDGDEGTDLAREIRQQKVISAIKEKALSSKTLLNPIKLINIFNITNSHIETNLDNNSIFVLGKLVLESRKNLNYLSIPEEFLEVSQNNKKQDYQYVFIPKSGIWIKLQEWIKNSL